MTDVIIERDDDLAGLFEKSGADGLRAVIAREAHHSDR